MRTRSYIQVYNSGDKVISCMCGFYKVTKHISNETECIDRLGRTWFDEALPDLNNYSYIRKCPACGNKDFIEAKQYVVDYVRTFDNPNTVRIVAQFSTYCNVSSQKCFRRTTHRFSISFNKVTHKATLKFKGKLRQVNRILRQTNKGHNSNLAEMLNTPIKGVDNRNAVMQFEHLVSTYGDVDIAFNRVSLEAARHVTLSQLHSVLMRSYYTALKDCHFLDLYDFRNELPCEVMKLFHDLSSPYDILSKLLGFRISKPLFRKLINHERFFKLIELSHLTKNPDLLLKLFKNGYGYYNSWPPSDSLSIFEEYVKFCGQEAIDHAFKYTKITTIDIDQIADSMRLLKQCARHNLSIPKFRSFRQHHDDLTYQIKLVNRPVEQSFLTNKAIPISTEQGDYQFKVIRDTTQLRNISDRLNNCVASYLSKIKTGNTVIIDMQKDGDSFCCIEYDVTQLLLVQAKLNCNRKPDECTRRTIIDWANANQLMISPNCHDLKSPQLNGTITGRFAVGQNHGGYVNMRDPQQVLDYEARRQGRLAAQVHRGDVLYHHAENALIQGQAAHEMAERQIAAYHEAYPQARIADAIIDEVAVVPDAAFAALLEED